ncbi:MAG: GNAT family N-acetyltransferase [Proteobacteria bacterium]|nr:GNAT family N-acetyltransferase [Pseudomonadota bacterium]
MFATEHSAWHDIETTRLTLRLLAPEAMEAALSGDLAALEDGLGAEVPPDLLHDPAVLRFALAELAADADYLSWSARAIVLKDPRRMIGHVRFHSRPDPDYLHRYARKAVEFGYVVFAAYRRQGYAREALASLMQWAHEAHGVDRFVASVSPDNLPSQRLIAAFDFKRVGEHSDAVDGVEHVYLRDLRARS